jgi:hypothetical protein
MYTNANADLPPLVAASAELEEPADTGVSRIAIAALAALLVAVLGVGWGITQWSSARDWRHRSAATETHFDDLEARAERAEVQRVTAQRTVVKTRARLVRTEKQLAKEADQLAFTRDLRIEMCELAPLTADQRARVCP